MVRDPLRDQFWKPDTNARSVGASDTLEGFIPIWGSGRTAINAFQNGRYGSGVLNGGLAALDLFFVGRLLYAGKAGLTGLGAAGAREGAAEVGGRALFGMKAPPPTGPLSDPLRALFLQNANSPWFRFKANMWSSVNGLGRIDWAVFMQRLGSSEFRNFATAGEAIRSFGWAGRVPGGGGRWLFGIPQWSRWIPVIGRNKIQHELIHALQDFKYGVFAVDEASIGLFRGAGIEGAAHLYGGPVIGVGFVAAASIPIAGGGLIVYGCGDTLVILFWPY